MNINEIFCKGQYLAKDGKPELAMLWEEARKQVSESFCHRFNARGEFTSEFKEKMVNLYLELAGEAFP